MAKPDRRGTESPAAAITGPIQPHGIGCGLTPRQAKTHWEEALLAVQTRYGQVVLLLGDGGELIDPEVFLKFVGDSHFGTSLH